MATSTIQETFLMNWFKFGKFLKWLFLIILLLGMYTLVVYDFGQQSALVSDPLHPWT